MHLKRTSTSHPSRESTIRKTPMPFPNSWTRLKSMLRRFHSEWVFWDMKFWRKTLVCVAKRPKTSTYLRPCWLGLPAASEFPGRIWKFNPTFQTGPWKLPRSPLPPQPISSRFQKPKRRSTATCPWKNTPKSSIRPGNTYSMATPTKSKFPCGTTQVLPYRHGLRFKNWPKPIQLRKPSPWSGMTSR